MMNHEIWAKRLESAARITQHPESIGDKERIIYPMVILVLEVAAEDEIVPHRYPHGTI